MNKDLENFLINDFDLKIKHIRQDLLYMYGHIQQGHIRESNEVKQKIDAMITLSYGAENGLDYSATKMKRGEL